MLELNKIYCMDCLEFLKQIDDNSVDLVVTSPPYNIGKDYGIYKDNKVYEDYINFLLNIFKLIFDKMRNGCRICINIGYIYVSKNANNHSINTEVRQLLPTYADLIVNLRKIGYSFQEHFIWNKIGNSKGNKMIFGSYPFPCDLYCKSGIEHILVFKKGSYRNDIKEKRLNKNNKLSQKEWYEISDSIWKFNGERMNLHCGPFPLELPKRCIKAFSFQNDLILDCFMGSGTTAVACKQLGRNFIGCDISQEYVTIANKRLEQENLLNIIK